MRTLPIVLPLALLLGCGGNPPPAPVVSPDLEDAPEKLTVQVDAPIDGMLPPPFSVEQVRTSLTVGTRMRYRSQKSGEPAELLDWVVTAADESAVTIEVTRRDEGGAALAEPTSRQTAWQEMVDKTRYPAGLTGQGGERLDTPAGVLDTRRYSVSTPDGSRKNTYWFAERYPGPSVRMIALRDGEEVGRVELIERTSPDDAATP